MSRDILNHRDAQDDADTDIGHTGDWWCTCTRCRPSPARHGRDTPAAAPKPWPADPTTEATNTGGSR